MNMMRNLMMVGLATVCGLALAEKPGGGTADARLKALTLKQEMVRDRFERFRERMFQLAEDLAEVEPENAARLARTLEQAGELGLDEELNRVAELLGNSSSLAEALDRQEKWMVDAQRLMDILLEKDSLNEQRKDRIDELKEYQQKLDDILKEQRALRAQAGQASRAKRMLQQVEQAIKRLDAMLDQQKGVSQKTAAQPAGGPSGRQKLGQQQKNLSHEAKVLSEDLKRLGDLKRPQEPSGQTPDSPKLDKAGEAAKSAGKSVQSGAQSMAQAAKNLEKDQPSDAKEQQKQAEKQLKEARQKLEEARDALKQKSKAASNAASQRATAQQTRQLRDKMKGDGSKGKSGSSGKPSSKGQQGKGKQGKQGKQSKQSGGPKPSEPTPGSENLDRAQQKMDDAAEKLEKENPDDATESQDQAIEELEEAQRELEDVLLQLRREERAEMLRDLEDRFRDLLLKQRAVNDKTVELDGVGREHFQRAEQLRLADLAAAERQLQAKASTCVHILEEEGTTIAFPRVVGQIAEDMGVVADRLGRAYVGSLTQRIEDEVVATLEQLLEALKKMQQDNEQQSGQAGQSGGNKDDPLLPTSAELKLLRSSQARVNTRTNVIEERRAQEAEPADELAKAFKQAAGRQKECAEIAEEMRDQADQ